MRMRDSWNVWREKVNGALGGLTEPIEAKDVVFDKTGTTMSATNAQGAIEEVNSGVNANATEVSGIKSKLENTFAIVGQTKFAVTATTGTKGDLINKTCADFMRDVISALEDDELISFDYATYQGLATFTCYTKAYLDKDAANANFSGYSVNQSGSNYLLYRLVGYSGTGTAVLSKATINNSGNTIEALAANTVDSAGETFTIFYTKYKKLS